MHLIAGLKALVNDIFGTHPSPNAVTDHSVTVEDLIVPGESILRVIPFDQAGEEVREVAGFMLDTPYVWSNPPESVILAGDIEKAKAIGGDCSGITLTILRHLRLVSEEWCKNRTTSQIAIACEAVDAPKPCDLAYYEGHVAIVVGYDANSTPYVLSMSGGDSSTTSVSVAKATGAKAKLLPYDYRTDFVCFMRPVS